MGLSEEVTHGNGHQKQLSISELEDLTFLEILLPDEEVGKATIEEVLVDEMKPKLPESHLVLITKSGTLIGQNHARTGSVDLLQSIVDELDVEVHGKLKVRN